MKASVFNVDGEKVGEVELPPVFAEEVRLDLIKRAVLSEESFLYQPKGNYRWAGMETSADYIGRKEAYRSLKNRGQAMLPREKLPKGRWGRVRRIPSAVGGRRAHPPKVEKNLRELINKKEYAKAFASALAACAVPDFVNNRLRFEHDLAFPVVLEEQVLSLTKSKDVVSLLGKLGLSNELDYVKERRKRLTGVRRLRRNKVFTQPKGLLFIVPSGEEFRAARNVAGVDVVDVERLQVRHLAPGTLPGRPVMFVGSALEEVVKKVVV